MRPEPAVTEQVATASICRNCGAATSRNFCAACGQETRVQLPTARVFLREATGRYVALDGRLWRTLAGLMFRPGFLTREYLLGRRRRYIRPARLFLVLALALFAAIRIFANAPVIIGDDAAAKTAMGSAEEPIVKFDEGESGGDINLIPGIEIHVDRGINLKVLGANTPWSRELKKRFDHFNRLDRQEKSEQLFAGMVRYGPYAMFVLMPAFAMLQMMAYAGRGRRYPDRPRRYAEHLVFASHIHAFLFFVCVLALAIPNSAVRDALALWCLIYGALATQRVYRGRWIGLFARAILVGLAYLVLFAFVIAGLVFVAVLLA